MEDMQLYRPILKRGWQITWRNKSLWFFGLFASLLGAGGEYEIVSRAASNPKSQGAISAIWGSFQGGLEAGLNMGGNLWHNLLLVMSKNPLQMAVPLIVLVLVMALGVFIIWLAVVSQIALIRNVSILAKAKKATANEGIDFAVKNFWPTFWVNVIWRVAVFALFVLLGWLIIFLAPLKIWGTILYAVIFVVVAIATIAVSFLAKFQIYHLIVKKEDWRQALASAWQMLIGNWLSSLEMAAIFFVIFLLAITLTAFVVAILVAVPFILPVYIPISWWLATAVAFICLLLIISISLIINALLNAFQWAAWTLFFARLDAGDAVSKIMRGARVLPGYFTGR